VPYILAYSPSNKQALIPSSSCGDNRKPDHVLTVTNHFESEATMRNFTGSSNWMLLDLMDLTDTRWNATEQ